MNQANNGKPAAAAIDVVIIGAGFAGLYAIHRLRLLGMSLRCFEAAGDVGGVWFWNRYPGARCDVESLQYSYSFSAELDQEWVWTERFAAQPEILSYIRHVAERFDLRRDIAFSTRVERITWREHDHLWEVVTGQGETVLARFCVMASGSLSVSRIPDLRGIERFKGQFYHTGAWPDEPIDFRGRRVAVIGTGSSGIQAIPVIAEQAAQLYVVQRTPNFIIPSRNRPLDDETQAGWKRKYPELRAQGREVGTLYEFSGKGALEVDAETRQREYERRWQIGGVNFVHAFNNLFIDDAANETAAEFVRGKIREIVQDPAIAARLSPTDHPIGAKRICVASGYYETFNRPNVQLIDVRDEPLQGITPAGLRTSTAEYPVDIIVFATGYDALTGALTRIDIRGIGGQALRDKWSAGPANYIGLMTAGFPNMFIITGPGSPSVLVNMVVGIEHHVDWIVDCLAHLRSTGARTIEATETAEKGWVAHVNEEAGRTVFVKANSWYLGANIPGKPRIFLPYAGGLARYRAKCAEIAERAYEGFSIQ